MYKGIKKSYAATGSHGYIYIFDVDGKVLLQKKSYFQNFSIQRNVFHTEPVCANPGQYTLPGGTMNTTIMRNDGTFSASLKQFNEESGVTLDILQSLDYSEQGCYFAREDGQGNSIIVNRYYQ